MTGKVSKIVLVSLLLCNTLLLLALYSQQGIFVTNDSLQYQALANNIANGQYGHTSNGIYYPEPLRLPGYPLYLLVCQSIFGDGFSSVIVVQMVLHLVALLLVFGATKNAFGETTGFIFLGLALTFSIVAHSAIAVLPETITILLLSLAVFLLSKREYRARPSNFVIAGILLGASVYFRPNLLPNYFIVALFIFISGRQYRKSSILLTGALIITIAPWTLYNYQNFGFFSPTTAEAGFEIVLYQATLESTGLMVDGEYESITDARIQNQLKQITSLFGLPADAKVLSWIYAPASPAEMLMKKKVLRQAALENIAADPASYFSWVIKNIPRLWIASYALPPDASPIYRYSLLLWRLFVLLLAIAGCVISVFQKKEDARFFGFIISGVIFSFTVILCWLHFETRYSNTAKLLLLAAAAVSINFLLSKFIWVRQESESSEVFHK